MREKTIMWGCRKRIQKKEKLWLSRRKRFFQRWVGFRRRIELEIKWVMQKRRETKTEMMNV